MCKSVHKIIYLEKRYFCKQEGQLISRASYMETEQIFQRYVAPAIQFIIEWEG